MEWERERWVWIMVKFSGYFGIWGVNYGSWMEVVGGGDKVLIL
jgi:hypothetical protein